MKTSLKASVIGGLALALASTGALAQAKKKTAAAAATPAPAATPAGGGVGMGDTEIGFFGSLRDEGVLTALTLGVSFGNYTSDNLELRLTQTFSFIDAGGISTTVYSPYGSAEYQIVTPGSAFVPYVGGGFGMFLLSNDDFFMYSLFLTPVAGVKYFLNERTSIEYGLSYQFPLIGEACSSATCDDADITTLQNSLRFNIYY